MSATTMRLRSAIVNKQARSVRKRGAPDRRVGRTKEALVLALVELAIAKRYRSITIRDLLDRAGVGRSTFYSHYRSKDDLLLTSFVAMLDGLDAAIDADPPGAQRIAPVRELFHHVGSFDEFLRALARARMLELMFQAGVEHVAGPIEQRLRAAGVRRDADALAAAAAGALFALLRHWIGAKPRPDPEAMDALFHTFVLPGVRTSIAT